LRVFVVHGVLDLKLLEKRADCCSVKIKI
jgi:hypothetical protein